MQKGLREDRKISEYEKKKRFVTSVAEIMGLVVFGIMLFMLYLSKDSFRFINGISWMLIWPFVILAGIEFVIYLSNVLICAVLDHVIEMCYANQYRIMKDTAIAVEGNEVEK